MKTYYTAAGEDLFFLMVEDEKVFDLLAWDPAGGHGSFSLDYLEETARAYPISKSSATERLQRYLGICPKDHDERFIYLLPCDFIKKTNDLGILN